jgi:hypothetical protein
LQPIISFFLVLRHLYPKKKSYVRGRKHLDNTEQNIGNRIFPIRGLQVMLDSDLAEVYGVGAKVLNQAVKRNIERFPEKFRFQLSMGKGKELVANFDQTNQSESQALQPRSISINP